MHTVRRNIYEWRTFYQAAAAEPAEEELKTGTQPYDFYSLNTTSHLNCTHITRNMDSY